MNKDQCVCPQCTEALREHRNKSDRDFYIGLVVLLVLVIAILHQTGVI